MYHDEVIDEVWRIRDEYVKQHHYSLDEIVEDLRRRQAEHPSRVVDRRRQRTNNDRPKEPRQ
jgi:hypothetical protein